ncbi:MAG: hypothetical protein F6J95_000350 [Leptolyngbya sp. SIO1E4]|nr:hypothetical protein [Leptolyngbya sp. SIO1E4]
MPRKQMLKREREGQLCIDDPASEGLQLSLLPGQVAPFGLPYQGDAPKEGRSVSPPEPDVLVRVVSPSVADSTEGELRRHSPKGQASGWLETRIGNKTRKHPSTSYYYCWDEVVAAGETRRQKVYVKVSKVAAVRHMLNERRSVEEILRVLQG